MDRLATPTAAAASLALLAGCSAGATGSTDTTEDATGEASAEATTQVPPDSALEGAWLIRLSRDRAAELLRQAGVGNHRQKFFATQDWAASDESVTIVYTFTPIEGTTEAWSGDFQVAYYEANDVWKVGWKGALGVEGNEMAWTDDLSGVVDRFTFDISGDRLLLDWQGADVEEFDGMPPEVYAAAYLTDPLTRTDCPMEPGVDC